MKTTKKYSDKGESKKHEKGESKAKEIRERQKEGKLPARMHGKELLKKAMAPVKKYAGKK